MTKIADILQRVSTKRQVKDDKLGLHRQDLNITNWLKVNQEYTVREQIIIKGKSAYKGAHLKGEFGSYLQRLENSVLSPPNVLIIDDFSRLSRLPLKQARAFVERLSDYGITIVTASDSTVYSPNIHDSIEGILGLLFRLQNAHAESERKSKHIRSAKKAKRDQVMKNGGRITFGNPPKWLKVNSNDEFELIPYRAEAVKLIFECINADMSKGATARLLNERQIKGWDRYGVDTLGKWDSTKISRICTSKAVTGTHLSRTWTKDGNRKQQYMWTVEALENGFEIPNAYPRITSDEAFAIAQLKRDSHFQNLAKKPRSTENSGKVIVPNAICGICGSNMRYKKSSNGEQYSEFICSNKTHSGMCTNASMNYKTAETAVLRLLFDFVDLSPLLQENTSNDLLIARKQELLNEIEALTVRIKEKGGKVSSVIVLLLDDLETELAELEQVLLLAKKRTNTGATKDWKSILNGEPQERVKCRKFIESFVHSIEIENIKRGKKLIRIIGEQIGCIFAVIEGQGKNKKYDLYTGTY